MTEYYEDSLTDEEIAALEKKQLENLIPRYTKALEWVIKSNPEFALESLKDKRKEKMICDVAFLLSYDFESDADRQETIDEIRGDYPWFNLVQNLDDLKKIEMVTQEDMPVIARMLPQLLKKEKNDGTE
jgi:hypothetical protein